MSLIDLGNYDEWRCVELEHKLDERDRLLNIFLKVCKDETGYINPNYGNGKLYIDACSEITEEERELFIKFCKENNIKTIEEDGIENIASKNFVELGNAECEKYGLFDKFREAHEVLEDHNVKDDWGNGTKEDPYIILATKTLEKFISENYKVDENNVVKEGKAYYKIVTAGGEKD